MVGIWGKFFFFLVFKLISIFPLVSMECFHNEERNASWHPPHSLHLAPNRSSVHFLSWSHSPTHFGMICSLCLSLGFPWKYPASSWVLTVFPGNHSHPSLLVYCYCCPCSGLCASFQMNSWSPCTLHEVPSSSPAIICLSPVQTLTDLSRASLAVCTEPAFPWMDS